MAAKVVASFLMWVSFMIVYGLPIVNLYIKSLTLGKVASRMIELIPQGYEELEFIVTGERKD